MAPEAESMGRVSRRLHLVLAVASVTFVAVLAVSPVKDLRSEWKLYKRGYVRFAESRPETKRLLADYRSDIDQIWIPDMNVVDRCTTCHQGLTQATLDDPSVPQPYRAHPAIPHHIRDWGCVVCHRGQGPATQVAEAHETTLAWEQPILSASFIQGSCGVCHRADLSVTPRLNRGRQLLTTLNCAGCHRLQDIAPEPTLGPDLDDIGSKTTRAWIYKWLKEPQTVLDKDGNVSVDGYMTPGAPRMPQFRLSEAELRALSAYLSEQRAEPLSSYTLAASAVSAWAKRPDVVSQGEARFREMFCSTCHALAVTRAGETQLVGGSIGPELTKVGSKVNRNWLMAWLLNPQALLPDSKMPRYQWSDTDLYLVTGYIMAQLTDADLLSDVPQLGPAAATEVQLGRRLFQEKGCASCHRIRTVPVQHDFGPDLSALGSKTVSQLEFGQSRIARNLISYIQAKITDPTSVNPAARMPQYHLSPDDLNAVVTVLLSMTGPPSTNRWQALLVRPPQPEFKPTGSFGEVYRRYRCDACHRFSGYGGNLAPDLSWEGSRARREWLISFLKNPQTIRPTLTFRMPQFNMTDQEAQTIADYLGMVMLSPSVSSAAETRPAAAELVALGKQLYEVKYQCQACHTIGSSGGYVGPNLSNAGNWLTAGWMAAWLRNPQALVPGTIEPTRAFSENERNALTAYLLTLRQAPSQTKADRKGSSSGSLAAGAQP